MNTISNLLLYKDKEISDKININSFKQFETILIPWSEHIDSSIFIKSKWKKSNKIISIDDNEVMVSLKLNGSWRTFSEIEIELLYSKYKKSYKINYDSLSKNEEDVSIKQGILIFSNSYKKEKLIDKINWILSDEFSNDVKKIYEQNGFLFYSFKKIEQVNNELFEIFKNKIINNEKISGVEYSKFSIENAKITLDTIHGKIIIDKISDEEVSVESIFESNVESFEVINFDKAILINIKKNICLHPNSKVNLPLQIFKILFGIGLFIILLTLTFTFIFDTSNIAFFFSSFTNDETWRMPWMYLIFGCFISSYIVTILMGMILDKYTLKRDKLEFKRAMHYFVAGSLRGAATFFTGNLFIAMFAWTWYLNRKLEIRTTSLIKVYSTTSIIRVFVIAIFGLMFMSWGTISYYMLYNPEISPLTTGIVVSSWIGFAWQLIHSSAIYFLLTSTFIATLFLNSVFRIKNAFGKYTSSNINNLYFNKEQYHKSKLNLNLKDGLNIFIIFTIWTLLMIFIEGFDTIFHFNYIEKNLCLLNNYEFNSYEHLLSIISLRYMSLQIHHIPIINILPGRGLFFSELGLKVLYEPVLTNHHGSFDYFPGYNSEDMAEIVSFSTRFFGMYLKNIVSVIIAMWVVIFALIKK